MTTLYSCKHAGDEYRITKFDDDMNVVSSYLCNHLACDCPAGVRDTCRHRQMLPKFLARSAVGTAWFLDYDRNGWVQTDLGEGLSEAIIATDNQPPEAAFNNVEDMLEYLNDGGNTARIATGTTTAKPFRRGL